MSIVVRSLYLHVDGTVHNNSDVAADHGHCNASQRHSSAKVVNQDQVSCRSGEILLSHLIPFLRGDCTDRIDHSMHRHYIHIIHGAWLQFIRSHWVNITF